MKSNFKFLIILVILLSGCICVGSTFAAESDMIITDVGVDNTQNMEITHVDSSAKNDEISSVSSVSSTNYTDMVQYDDYFFGIDYSKIDYDVGYNYYNKTNITQNNGACSSFSKDGMVGRSYDWFYDYMASIVVSVSDAKYKNIGVAGRLLNQNDCLNIINNVGDYDYKLEVLPFCLLDGINEAGLYCNNNMAPGDKPYGTYARAAKETRVIIAAPMLPRFILDNFGSAKEAAEYIRDYCDVYNEPKVQLHTMISDSSGACYVLEYFDNKTWVNEDQIAMTNFYVTGVKFNENGTVPTPLTNECNVTGAGNLTPHSNGLERYNIIINDYNDLNTVDDFWNTLHKVRFSNCAFSTDPVWASDLTNIDDPLSESNLERINYEKLYNNRSRDNPTAWQSIHQCVYDLDNLVLYVETQEKDGYHIFKLNKTPVTVTINPIKGKVGEKVKVTATITDENGNLISNGEVIFELDGKNYTALIKEGIATTHITLPSSEGNYTLTAYYAGNSVYQEAYDVFIVEVTKDIPGPNPDPNPTPKTTPKKDVNNPVGNMENTGNPLLVLLIALGAIGLESFRRKF